MASALALIEKSTLADRQAAALAPRPRPLPPTWAVVLSTALQCGAALLLPDRRDR